jgi:Phosphodiesterase/alkaline phosphatase D
MHKWSCRSFSLPLVTMLLMLLMSGTPAATVTFTHGVASGELKPHSAVLWTRLDEAATLLVEVSTDPTFPKSQTLKRVAVASADNDFTVKAVAAPLSPDQLYYYRWRKGRRVSEVGSFKTPPLRSVRASVSFTYTGDTDGTFLGPTPFHNNFEVFDAIRNEEADFFIYLGDTIYADSSLRTQSLGLPPATTLDEFRDLYKINRGFSALANLLKSTSTYAIWDDHEVRNDFDGQTVDPTLYAAGRKAFLEYMPIHKAGFPMDPNCAGNPLFRIFRADPEAVAREFTTGPVAEFTLEEGIRQFANSIGANPDTFVQGFNGLLDLVGVDCRDLGGVRPLLGGMSNPAFTYGLVEVDANAGMATITLKDQEGKVLADKDPSDPSDLCARTIGP